jgi:hypothetical protein
MFVRCEVVNSETSVCAVESANPTQFTPDEVDRLEAVWPGGERFRFPDHDVYEVWCTGFGPAMTFTKVANGKIVVTDLLGEFMTSGTNLPQVILAVLAILKLDLSDIQGPVDSKPRRKLA